MSELTLDEAQKEGAAVREMAKSKTRRSGSENEPSVWTYDEALQILNKVRCLDENTADIMIDTLDQWRQIRQTIGDKDADSLANAAELFTRKYINDIDKIAKNVEAGNIDKMNSQMQKFWSKFKETPEYIGIVSKYPDIKPLLSEYLSGSSKLVTAFM